MKFNIKWVKAISNITFVLAIGLSLFLIVNFFILRSSLPPGVCPIKDNRPFMYVAIGLALISFIFSLVEDRLEKD